LRAVGDGGQDATEDLSDNPILRRAPPEVGSRNLGRIRLRLGRRPAAVPAERVGSRTADGSAWPGTAPAMLTAGERW